MHSSIAYNVLLYAPIVLYRHQFCSLANGTSELFTSAFLSSPSPQIWEPYSIVGLTTAIYRRRVRLKEGPYVEVAIRDAAANAAAPL